MFKWALSWKTGLLKCMFSRRETPWKYLCVGFSWTLRTFKAVRVNVPCQWGSQKRLVFCRGLVFAEALKHLFLFHLDRACQLRQGNVFSLLRGSLNGNRLFSACWGTCAQAHKFTSVCVCVCWVIHVHDYVHVPGPVKGVQKVPKRLDIPYNVHISKERLVLWV